MDTVLKTGDAEANATAWNARLRDFMIQEIH
jgi:hypothetical protein